MESLPDQTPAARPRRAVWAWAMYDWANSAFATTIMAAVLPAYFAKVAAAPLAESDRTAVWAATSAVASLVVAAMAPLLGVLADRGGWKKRFLVCFAILGIVSTGLLALTGSGQWVWVALLYLVASIGFAGGNIFYDAFLPEIAPAGQLDRVSTLGFSLGYAGGGLLLVVNLLMLANPTAFGLADAGAAARAAFVMVAVWWALFSLPLLLGVHERRGAAKPPLGSPLRAAREAFASLARTFREISQFRPLLLFLVAFWLYNDGIGTIIRLATVYGEEIGIGTSTMLQALLLTQVIGIPCTLLFGRLAGRIGTRPALVLALCCYVGITLLAAFMRTGTHFFLLAAGVGVVQGGAQGLSRSLYGSMIPEGRHAEFFSFFGLSSKFSAILGPLLFAAINQATGNSRLGIASILLFFIVGIVLLLRVDVNAARQTSNA